MKNITLLAALLGLAVTAKAQTDMPSTGGKVEKSLFNVQTGFAGLWVSSEVALSNSIALRSELGMEVWYYDSFWTDEKGAVLAPSLSVEPRWYYNIAKRDGKGKYTANNSANFLTLAVEFYPDLFLVGSAPSYVHIPNQISFIPKWGMRRSIAHSNFNYELGIGLGYLLILDD
ncbi:MAG: hypothetical protein EOP54_31425, partial [Sphingobacteriales bacterium]